MTTQQQAFFKALRELCKEHGAYISARHKAEVVFQFKGEGFLTDMFDASSYTVWTLQNHSIDSEREE